MYSYVNIGNARHTGRCATHGSLVSGRNELSSAICLATASHSSPLFSLIFIAYSSLQLVSWWPPKTNDFGHDVGHVFERIPGLLSTSQSRPIAPFESRCPMAPFASRPLPPFGSARCPGEAHWRSRLGRSADVHEKWLASPWFTQTVSTPSWGLLLGQVIS